MVDHVLKKEDFKEIFSEIVFFRNRKNSFVEIGYIYYDTFRVVKFYFYNSEICNIDGNICMIELKKIERLLNELDIKELD